MSEPVSALRITSPPAEVPAEKAERPAKAVLYKSDVADLLGCSRRQVERLLAENRLPAGTRLGARLAWPKKIIIEWIESGMPPPRRK